MRKERVMALLAIFMEYLSTNKRIAMSLFGVIICAISVGIFKIAALGVDPFQSFIFS